jgi:hypothetical protein
MLLDHLVGVGRRRLMIVRERRLRVRGEMERVYRLGLHHLGGLRMAFRVSSGVIEGNRGSVELLRIVSSHCQLKLKSLPVCWAPTLRAISTKRKALRFFSTVVTNLTSAPNCLIS